MIWEDLKNKRKRNKNATKKTYQFWLGYEKKFLRSKGPTFV